MTIKLPMDVEIEMNTRLPYDFDDIIRKIFKEYATDDRLHNFKIAGELQKCTAVKALGGMMAKHTVSVYDLIDDYEQGKAISKEMWAEKIGDSINYLLLLTAMLEEKI